jgi:MFS family permease
MFPVAGTLVAVGALATLALPRGGAEALRAERGDWRELLRRGPFRRLLLYTFVSYLSVQGPMALFPILVKAQGGGVEAVSRMWILMLVLEVPLVAYLGASISRVGVRGVISIGMLAAGVRWLVSGLTDDLAWMTAAQILHGVTVWGVVLGIPMYIDAVVPERLRSTGQGLVAMLGVSLGGMLSNLSAGWLIDHVGPGAPATVGGAAALVLGALCVVWLPRPRDYST